MATRGSVNMSKAEVHWNGEIFHRLGEAQAETERWPIHYTPNVHIHRWFADHQHQSQSPANSTPHTKLKHETIS